MVKQINKQVIRATTVCFISKRDGKMQINTMYDVSKMSKESIMLVKKGNEIFWI